MKSGWMIAGAVLATVGGGAYAMETGGGHMDQGSHGSMGHGQMDHGQMDQGQVGHGEMDRERLSQSQMDHGEMDRGEMDRGEMDHGAAAASDDPVIARWMAINDRMHAGMMFDFSGEPDVDFALGMIPHHQGAIEMAEAVLEHGEDPEIRALAEEIIAAQESEIAFLKSWLEERGY